MIEQVTLTNIDSLIERFTKARGGAQNDDTTSEAMFIYLTKYAGVSMLHVSSAIGIYWIGLQNATARATKGGKPYASIKEAIMLMEAGHVTTIGIRFFYTDDAVERLRMMAAHVEVCRKSGDFLLYSED